MILFALLTRKKTLISRFAADENCVPNEPFTCKIAILACLSKDTAEEFSVGRIVRLDELCRLGRG